MATVVVMRDAHRVSTGLFLRALGGIYLIAFLSLWVQIDGLIGSEGILPVESYLDWVRAQTGTERFWKVPTWLWLSASDAMLHVLSAAGALAACALIAGIAPRPVLLLLWTLYLSLVHGGQTFLSFQWDTLLLETGLCALFVAPPTATLSRAGGWAPSPAGLWLIRLLLFKLMFLSGMVKPLSMDDTWWGLTALDYHYWTQPIPNWISWYADRLPSWFQQISVLLTYAIEILLPFAVFAGHVGRRAFAAGTVLLMLLISWTGNYGFFNLLTIVLCIPLLDDRLFGRSPAPVRPGRRWPRVVVAAAVSVLLTVSAIVAVRELARTGARQAGPRQQAFRELADRWLLGWAEPTILGPIAPFRSVNGYGLFRSMTTARPEIVVEGSRDGRNWHAYEFRWKAGDPTRAPGVVAPHMPRLDWQMWFAALNPRGAQPWLQGLMRGLLRGSAPVTGLLDSDPFEGDPPRYIRLMYYDYSFASAEQRRRDGAWWSRELRAPLTSPLTLEQLGG